LPIYGNIVAKTNIDEPYQISY